MSIPPTPSTLPKLYTIKEAAAALKVHYGTMCNWVNSGEIRSVRVGLRKRVPEDAILNFLGIAPKTESKPRPTHAQIERELEAIEKRWKI